jgi:hypothetical protein
MRATSFEGRCFSPTGTFVRVTRSNEASAVVAEEWLERKGLLLEMVRDVNLELEWSDFHQKRFRKEESFSVRLDISSLCKGRQIDCSILYAQHNRTVDIDSLGTRIP